MTRLWKAFVLVVALAAVACEAIRRSRYEDIVNQAIEGYNNGRPGKPLFRLVDYTVLPLLTSTSIILLEFRIKETECLSFLDTQHQNCSFLEDGVFSQLPDCLAGGAEALSSFGSLHITSSSFNRKLLSAQCIKEPGADMEERNCTGQFLRRWWSTSLTSICDRDCSREAALLYNYPDYPVEDLPSEIRNIYENAQV